ncbi:MAG: biotin/lipoyl-containing protein [Candidatus Binatia bacterium]
MGIHRFIIEETEFEVHVGPRQGNRVAVNVNGMEYDVDIAGSEAAAAASPAPVRTEARQAAAAPAARPASGGSGEVRAPISGVVLRIAVTVGQKVTRGTELLTLEAMKMENPILAWEDGVIRSVDVKAQQEVREGELLVVIG